MSKHQAILGYASGWGAYRRGCADGANVLKQGKLKSYIWDGVISPIICHKGHDRLTVVETLPFVADITNRLATRVKSIMRHKQFPIIIGGDHSCAIGTWSGVTSAISAQEKFGLIWIDAHMDSHTPQTCNEGKWGGFYHGQPLAVLLGEGEHKLTKITGNLPKLAPEHISLIGVRSFEKGEEDFLNRKNVRVYFMDEVNKRGFTEVFTEAKIRAKNGTKAYGLSIDLDGFDPSDAPGVGSQESGGLLALEVLLALQGLAKDSNFVALEIAEYNPHLDRNNKTAKLVDSIIKNIFS